MSTEISKTSDLQASNQVERYVAATNGLKAIEANESELFSYLRNKVKLSYFEAGQDKNLDTETLNHICSILAKDIKLLYKSITLHEIGEAFSLGVRKTYGEYFGISVVTLLDWIKSYIKSEERAQALRNKKPEAKHRQLTQEELLKITEQIIPDMIAEYKRSGKVLNFGNVRYKHLVNKGLINEDHWQQFRQNAEVSIFHNIESERNKQWANRSEVKKLTLELDDMISKDHPRLYQEACNIAVQYWCAAEVKKTNG